MTAIVAVAALLSATLKLIVFPEALAVPESVAPPEIETVPSFVVELKKELIAVQFISAPTTTPAPLGVVTQAIVESGSVDGVW